MRSTVNFRSHNIVVTATVNNNNTVHKHEISNIIIIYNYLVYFIQYSVIYN